MFLGWYLHYFLCFIFLQFWGSGAIVSHSSRLWNFSIFKVHVSFLDVIFIPPKLQTCHFTLVFRSIAGPSILPSRKSLPSLMRPCCIWVTWMVKFICFGGGRFTFIISMNKRWLVLWYSYRTFEEPTPYCCCQLNHFRLRKWLHACTGCAEHQAGLDGGCL